nr:MAG TPA: hypothetical protein [Caudoviricetes sp.]
MSNHNKGNRKAQRERRYERRKLRPKRQEEKHVLIDGNYSFYPAAYCKHYQAWLTVGLLETHRCAERQCGRLEKEVMTNEN